MHCNPQSLFSKQDEDLLLPHTHTLTHTLTHSLIHSLTSPSLAHGRLLIGATARAAAAAAAAMGGAAALRAAARRHSLTHSRRPPLPLKLTHSLLYCLCLCLIPQQRSAWILRRCVVPRVGAGEWRAAQTIRTALLLTHSLTHPLPRSAPTGRNPSQYHGVPVHTSLATGRTGRTPRYWLAHLGDLLGRHCSLATAVGRAEPAALPHSPTRQQHLRVSGHIPR